VALWEALHGARPFAGSSRQELMSNIARGRTTAQRRPIPRWLHAVLLRGLRSDPDSRHRSMHELLRDLRRRPVIARWSRIALASTGAVMVAGALGFHETLRAREVCASEAAAFAEPWARRREAIAGAVADGGAPEAAVAARTVTRALDEHVRALASTSREACEARTVRGEVPRDVAQAIERCLHARAGELEALVATLERADAAALARAVDGLEQLGAPAACRRVERVVRAYAHEPSESARGWLVQGLARARAGEREAAIEAMWQAIWEAEAAGADELGARAWVELVRILAKNGDAEVERNGRLAEHAIARTGGDDRLSLSLTLVLADHALSLARADDAISLIDRRPSVDPTVPGELLEAKALALRGRAELAAARPDRAASDLIRALALTGELYGAEHPRTIEIRDALKRATTSG
jgi:hypothetical protein